MSNADQVRKVTAALECLREREQFFEFDNQERVVKVYDFRGNGD